MEMQSKNILLLPPSAVGKAVHRNGIPVGKITYVDKDIIRYEIEDNTIQDTFKPISSSMELLTGHKSKSGRQVMKKGGKHGFRRKKKR
ncbi:MAG: hypothetical protein AB9836_04665 [Aminipila sp.]